MALLLLIPVLAIGIYLALKRRHAVQYSSVKLLRDLPVTMAQRVRRLLPWINLLGLVLITVALARPQLGKEETRIRTEGIAVEMCVDKSGYLEISNRIWSNVY